MKATHKKQWTKLMIHVLHLMLWKQLPGASKREEAYSLEIRAILCKLGLTEIAALSQAADGPILQLRLPSWYIAAQRQESRDAHTQSANRHQEAIGREETLRRLAQMGFHDAAMP